MVDMLPDVGEREVVKLGRLVQTTIVPHSAKGIVWLKDKMQRGNPIIRLCRIHSLHYSELDQLIKSFLSLYGFFTSGNKAPQLSFDRFGIFFNMNAMDDAIFGELFFK